MKKELIVLLLFVTGCNYPSGVTSFTDAHGNPLLIEEQMTYPWTLRQKGLFGFAASMHYLDYESSRKMHFEDRSSGFYEGNSWLLGDHPEPEDIALFKAGMVVMTWALGEIWPEHRDTIFLCSGLSACIASGMNDRLYERHK